MNPKCGECGNDHTDPEKRDGDWCYDCFDAEMMRSFRDDSIGLVGIGNATYRSRPPKMMLNPSEYKKYGY